MLLKRQSDIDAVTKVGKLLKIVAKAFDDEEKPA